MALKSRASGRLMGLKDMTESQNKVLIVEARFYDDIVEEMAQGAIAYLEEKGVAYERMAVPGAFEIPGVIAIALKQGHHAGYIALGCVIRGQTTHYDYVCGESARGLMDLSVHHGAAVGNGIITVENGDQAWARASRDKKNKGRDAAEACLRMIEIKGELQPLSR